MNAGRNDPCPCGSGKKYKHCCHDKDVQQRTTTLKQIIDEALEKAGEECFKKYLKELPRLSFQYHNGPIKLPKRPFMKAGE